MERNEELTVPVAKRTKMQVTPKMWKREEVLVLLDLYEQTLTYSIGHTTENEDDLWIKVSEKLYDQGIEASPIHCQSKWNLLYKTYTANPSIGGVLFVKVKQVLDAIASIKEHFIKDADEEDAAELYKEERLEDETEMDEITVEEPRPKHTVISFIAERVTESTTGETEDGIRQLLEQLCGKIDTLTEIQHRQEARLEEVYQMQQSNEFHLLEIKKHFNIP